MIKRVIILGDSYTYGHGCSDRVYYYDENTKSFVGNIQLMYDGVPSEYCWASLLQQKFPELEVINLAMPGHSNQSMLRDLISFYEKHTLLDTDLIIFNGSFHSRMEVAGITSFEQCVSWTIGWDYMSPESTAHELQYPEYAKAKKSFVKYLLNDKIALQNSLAAMLAAHAFATGFKLKYMWNYPEHAYTNDAKFILRSINDTRNYSIVAYDFTEGKNHGTEKNLAPRNQEYYSPDFHVNDLGHKTYFEKEILPRINKILYEQ